MNKREYYDRQNELWEDNEIQQVKKEYEINKMTICEIGDIHHRTPGSISYLLKRQGIITHNSLARGYTDYIQSELYNDIITNGKIGDKKIKSNNEKKNKKIDKTTEINELKNEIIELKNEIIELKKYTKIMLNLIHQLYDFETS